MTDTSGTPASHGETLAPQRSQLVGTVVSLIAWLVVALPIILMFCMIAAPHLLGQAVRFRERAMWRSALITGVPTVCVVVYFIFRWLSNLG